MYCKDSPRAASTAVSKEGSGSIISAIKPRISLFSKELLVVSSFKYFFIMALTPSLYHSKLSAIFFKALNFDFSLFFSSSIVWTSLTFLPNSMLFRSSSSCLISMRSFRPFISSFSSFRCFSAFMEYFCVSFNFFFALTSSSSIIFNRLFMFSLLLAAF